MNLRSILTIYSLPLLVSCGSRSPELRTELQGNAITVDEPLAKFDQELTTPQKEITLKLGQTINIPVTIGNLTGALLASSGRHPITLSYKWIDHGQILPIEGERTLLHRPLEPGKRETVSAKVTAPQLRVDLTLRFTLVQEGVTWFFSKGAPTLDIPVHIDR